MLREWAAMTLGLSMLAGIPVEARADGPLIQWRTTERRGAFVLTDFTVSTLLQSGYTLVAASDETKVNISAGVAAGGAAGMAIPIANATIIYLQKGGDLIRCTEELPAYTSMLCWKLDPVPAQISGRFQQDSVLDPLVGRWTGLYPAHPDVKITMQVDDLETNRQIVFATVNSGGARTTTVAVLYFESTGDKIIAHFNPVGNMNAFRDKTTFQLISVNRIAWLESPFDGTAILTRDISSAPAPEPAGAIQPGTVTVQPSR